MTDNNSALQHRFGDATRAVRAGIATDREYGAVVPPIHLSSTFAFKGFRSPGKYDYTRSGNPTRSHLADALAELEHGASAVVTSTGMSAVTLVLQLLQPGDLILAAHDCYGGTQRLLRALSKRGNFELALSDLTCAAAEAEIIRQKPKLLWIETPSNPLLRITDVRSVSAAAHSVGALVVVDNTFLSPVLQQPLELGADIVVHSTTKYLNGHSDVVGGAVVARDAAVGQELGWWSNCLGVTGAPFDSYLTLRGVRTLHARMAVHLANTDAVVDALCAHQAVRQVHYPGLTTHPGHHIARAQQSGFGAMVSFELKGGVEAVEAFVAELRCFTLAESLGGVESLIAHPATMTHASMDEHARTTAGISDSLLRLSIGIELAADLVHDITTALDRVPASSRTTSLTAPHALQSQRAVPQRSAPVSPDRTDVVLLGAGAIGRELLEQITERRTGSGTPLRICGVIDRSGFVFHADGLSRERLAALSLHKSHRGSLASLSAGKTATALEALRSMSGHPLSHRILVDVTAAETVPILDEALARGWDIVLANKIPIAKRGTALQLERTALHHGRRILYEATVGAGLPVIDTLRKLIEAGDTISCIEGCPSGTLGYLFGELGHRRSFATALRCAVASGYTEPDPRIDLSGIDVARKALILARIIGFDGDLPDVRVDSLVPETLRNVSREEFLSRIEELDAHWANRVEHARSNGTVLRYRARVTPSSVTVGLVAVPLSDPLGALSGTDNQFAFTTARYSKQPLVITGPGAGSAVTAAGILNDLLRLTAEHGVQRTSRASTEK